MPQIMSRADSIPDTDVALVWMPFSRIQCPSIGLTLLKASLKRRGITAELFYFTLEMARLAGIEAYVRMTESDPYYTYLTGEWIFADRVFTELSARNEDYLRTFFDGCGHKRGRNTSNEVRSYLGAVAGIKKNASRFLEVCLAELLHIRPAVVGFSSVFQQQLASLALARMYKEVHPQSFIVFGGTNCRGIKGIEMIRQFPFVDAVVSGEGDEVFPDLVVRVLDNEPLAEMEGVYAQESTLPAMVNGDYPHTFPVLDLDALPRVDYDDYFEQLKKSGLKLPHDPILFCEGSRGCWWGKCAFCSLKCDHEGYRSKSGTRALLELSHLFGKYPNHVIQMVDNIMPKHYFQDLLPSLAKLPTKSPLFYALKSNPGKEDIRRLREAGILYLQPGIESLSTPILKMMRKGVTAIGNIQFLKWCREMALEAYWYLLVGFPKEPPEEYERMSRLIPWLTHLQPPETILPLYLARFSPHFENALQFGFADVRPAPAYQFIYPLPESAVNNLAYFYSYRYRETQEVEEYTKALGDALSRWRAVAETSTLCSIPGRDRLLIWDRRPAAERPLTIVTGSQRLLYEECDSVKSITWLAEVAAKFDGKAHQERDVARLLSPLLESGLMIEEGGQYLSLAIPASGYYPDDEELRELERHVRVLGNIEENEALLARVSLRDSSRQVTISAEELEGSHRYRRLGALG